MDLLRGTRPGGKTTHPGRRWSAKAFAEAVGFGDRTIRYWLRNEHLPPETETIERVLFGNDLCYAEWRLELRKAHAASGTTKKDQVVAPSQKKSGCGPSGSAALLAISGVDDLREESQRCRARAITGECCPGYFRSPRCHRQVWSCYQTRLFHREQLRM